MAESASRFERSESVSWAAAICKRRRRSSLRSLPSIASRCTWPAAARRSPSLRLRCCRCSRRARSSGRASVARSRASGCARCARRQGSSCRRSWPRLY
eukprot:4227331-Prymnesium_polylepis.1